MREYSGSSHSFSRKLFISIIMVCVSCVEALAGEASSPNPEGSPPYHGYETIVGVTSRAQTLLVFDGKGDRRLAVMTGDFIPSPQIFVNTPFHPFSIEEGRGGKVGRAGYYWKVSYNRFSLDRQEDPDTGGIGSTSPTYNYGTRVKGDFLAVAPVLVYERLRADGSVPFRVELGMGLGYLDLSGDIVLGDWKGDQEAPRTEVDYSDPSGFIFVMGRHQWGAFMFGYQMGISATISRPYSYSQSYVSLDFGYRVEL